MQILEELLCVKRERTTAKKQIKKDINIVKEWNIQRDDLKTNNHTVATITGEAFWFPAQKKGEGKNGLEECSRAEEDRKVVRVLEPYSFIIIDNKFIAGDGKDADCKEESIKSEENTTGDGENADCEEERVNLKVGGLHRTSESMNKINVGGKSSPQSICFDDKKKENSYG